MPTTMDHASKSSNIVALSTKGKAHSLSNFLCATFPSVEKRASLPFLFQHLSQRDVSACILSRDGNNSRNYWKTRYSLYRYVINITQIRTYNYDNALRQAK